MKYTIEGKNILDDERKIFATCDEPQKALEMMERAWRLNHKRQYTNSARLFAKVEMLPNFKWGDTIMKTQSTQTPTQWISEPINYDAYSAAIRLADPLTGQSNGMGTIAHLMGSKAVKNAELIIHAVNSHEALLDAVKLALKIMYANPENNIDMITGCSTTLKNAIAQAEGK